MLFTLCGRAGSKGIPGKNEMNFLGVPLVYYSLAVISLFCSRHPEISCTLALTTDSKTLRSQIKRAEVNCMVVDRPDALATERVSKVKAIAHAYAEAQRASSEPFDWVIDLDLTAPLRKVSDLEALVEARSSSDADTIFTVVKSRRNPYFNMVEFTDGLFCERVISSSWNARQEAPETYDMNASIYGYAPSFLESGKEIFEGTCGGS